MSSLCVQGWDQLDQWRHKAPNVQEQSLARVKRTHSMMCLFWQTETITVSFEGLWFGCGTEISEFALLCCFLRLAQGVTSVSITACRVKTNLFSCSKNKPFPPFHSSLFFPFYLCTTVKINSSVFIWFTLEDLTTSEFPPGHFNLKQLCLNNLIWSFILLVWDMQVYWKISLMSASLGTDCLLHELTVTSCIRTTSWVVMMQWDQWHNWAVFPILLKRWHYSHTEVWQRHMCNQS